MDPVARSTRTLTSITESKARGSSPEQHRSHPPFSRASVGRLACGSPGWRARKIRRSARQSRWFSVPRSPHRTRRSACREPWSPRLQLGQGDRAVRLAVHADQVPHRGAVDGGRRPAAAARTAPHRPPPGCRPAAEAARVAAARSGSLCPAGTLSRRSELALFALAGGCVQTPARDRGRGQRPDLAQIGAHRGDQVRVPARTAAVTWTGPIAARHRERRHRVAPVRHHGGGGQHADRHGGGGARGCLTCSSSRLRCRHNEMVPGPASVISCARNAPGLGWHGLASTSFSVMVTPKLPRIPR